MRPYLLQSRPYLVSQHWAAALESEWSSQLLLEKHLHLPPSVKPSDSRVGEAKGQIWFNNTFARPLFELVAQGIPCECSFSSPPRFPIQSGPRVCSNGTLCTADPGELRSLAGTRRRARSRASGRHRASRRHASCLALAGAERLPHRVSARSPAILQAPGGPSVSAILPPPPPLPQRRSQLVIRLHKPV